MLIGRSGRRQRESPRPGPGTVVWGPVPWSLSSTASNDQGVVHQFLVGLGVDPSTAHTAQHYAIVPLRVGLILLITVLASHFIRRLANRMVKSLRLDSPLVKATPRGQDRVRTLTGVVAGALRAALWVVAGLLILNEMHINLAPFVATATIVGAALGFGAQTLVRDFLSGLLILAEDQYGVGDHIVVGPPGSSTTGMVESVTLRVTRLRSLDGVVWYVPNGDIRTVGNDTENDSQALVDVVVPTGTDLMAAGAAAQAAAAEMTGEERWKSVLVGEPVFAGVVAVTHQGATIRVTAWTKPGQHHAVAREMRLRVIQRLQSEGLAWSTTLPAPQEPDPEGPAAADSPL